MQLTRNSIETARGPADWFSGAVHIDTVATPSTPSRCTRSASTSRRGSDGVAHASQRPEHLRDRGHRPGQRRGGPVEAIRPGDRVFLSRERSTGTARHPIAS
jgi:hypothetical protein